MDIREKKTQLSDFIKELIEIKQKLEELDHSFKQLKQNNKIKWILLMLEQIVTKYKL
jgi:hypothetical protein